MTIHHDKLAYGKLASDMEELSEEQLSEMLKLLNGEEEEEEEKLSDESCGKSSEKNRKKL